MADPVTISVVIATISRPTLARSLASLRSQDWRPGDEVLLVGDGPQPVAALLTDQFAAVGLPARYVENPGPRGMWGHHARNWVMDAREARGSHLMALDDDDEYLPGAIAAARAALTLTPDRPHLFKMDWRTIGGKTLWELPVLRAGNVGTPMFAAPNDPARLGRYGMVYTGDFAFIRDTCSHYLGGPVWREEVVCVCRPAQPARVHI